MLLEEAEVREALNEERCFGVYGSNAEALAAKQALGSATIREIERGLYAVIDLSDLEAQRPDYVLKKQIGDMASKALGKAGRMRYTFMYRWDESPPP